MEEMTTQNKRLVAKQCAHANLKRAVRKVTQHFDEELVGSDLRISQFTLLVASSLLGPSPLTELAIQLDLDRTTLTRNLKPLEREGLIESLPSKTDARIRTVQITPLGEQKIAIAYPLWQKAQSKVTQTIDNQAYAQLLTLLKSLQ